jgi:hypothetical protein
MSDANPVEVPDPFPLPEDAYFDKTPVRLLGATVVEATDLALRLRMATHLGFKDSAEVWVSKKEVVECSPAKEGDQSIYVTKGFAMRHNLNHEALPAPEAGK